MADPGERNVWRLDRQVSLALIVTLLLQAAGGFIWAGRTSARIEELKHRVDAQATVAERLARLEEQAALTRESLNRIEDKLERRAERAFSSGCGTRSPRTRAACSCKGGCWRRRRAGGWWGRW